MKAGSIDQGWAEDATREGMRSLDAEALFVEADALSGKAGGVLEELGNVLRGRVVLGEVVADGLEAVLVGGVGQGDELSAGGDEPGGGRRV